MVRISKNASGFFLTCCPTVFVAFGSIRAFLSVGSIAGEYVHPIYFINVEFVVQIKLVFVEPCSKNQVPPKIPALESCAGIPSVLLLVYSVNVDCGSYYASFLYLFFVILRSVVKNYIWKISSMVRFETIPTHVPTFLLWWKNKKMKKRWEFDSH